VNILVAPDSFKETLTANEVCDSIEKSFLEIFNDATIQKVPLADGGEGTVQTLVEANDGAIVKVRVKDPLSRDIEAYYGIINDGDTAIIEMATASGIELLIQEEKNPLETTSYGFGQLILNALNRGVKSFILGLGGSATNDAGIGMLQALGVKFFDERKQEFFATTETIKQIRSMDISLLQKRFKDITIKVACDVTNPLCGKNGASYTFAAQKGASDSMIQELDSKLFYFATLCEKTFEKETQNIKGSGAAGGLGFALVTFLDASLQSGIELIMQSVNLETKIKKANLIITGEGKMDRQSIHGKTPIGVAKLAKKYDKKVIAIVGCLDDGYEEVLNHGIDAIFDCTPISTDFQIVKKNAKKNLESTALNIAKSLKINIL
jgi:glycerate kinase